MSQAKHNNLLGFPELRQAKINPVVLVVLVIAIAVAGVVEVLRFVNSQEQHELLAWQKKLSVIADSRASDVEGWLELHFKELGSVADNPSLELYLMELLSQTNSKSPPAEDPSQTVFLRNLLSITADRLGFTEKPSAELQSINANVRAPTGVGLIIVDLNDKVLVSTAGLPALDASLVRRVDGLAKGQQSLIDIYKTDDGVSRIGFATPIYPIESDKNAAQQIGWLVGIKNVDDGLFKLLQHPGVIDKTLEAVLLRKDGESVDYLSPPKEDVIQGDTLALDTPNLDASYALSSPGSFAVKKNAQGHVSLMTSRTVARSPWVVLLHVDRDQALGESDVWLRQVEFSLFFGLTSFIGGIIAVWFYGTSRRTLLLSLETRRMALKSAAQEKLLALVADNQLEPILIVDQENTVRFANAKAAQGFHMTASDVQGKDISSLMGSALAHGYSSANQQALLKQAPFVRTWVHEKSGKVEVIRSEHIPLPHIPIDGLPIPSLGVLIVDQDITPIVSERERRMRSMRQLIDMLVHMVDKRDPSAATHSASVSALARVIATDMKLDAALIETAETAGKLMNVGKIIVPSSVLTKPSSLTDAERESIRESLRGSLAILKNVDFDGPVIATLEQSQERFDGEGPMKLKGDAILITARIIAATNAFVGMISQRSYREALSIDAALKNLLSEIDTQFDRRVVVSLADYIENKGGRDQVALLITK